MADSEQNSDIQRQRDDGGNKFPGDADGAPSTNASGFGMRQLWLFLGWLLIVISPLVGAVPGPGFIIIFPLGMALVLKNSLFAKRQYARLAKKYPAYGRWFNWALRRSREEGRPPAPDIWGDIKRIFRREKIGGNAE